MACKMPSSILLHGVMESCCCTGAEVGDKGENYACCQCVTHCRLSLLGVSECTLPHLLCGKLAGTAASFLCVLAGVELCQQTVTEVGQGQDFLPSFSGMACCAPSVTSMAVGSTSKPASFLCSLQVGL